MGAFQLMYVVLRKEGGLRALFVQTKSKHQTSSVDRIVIAVSRRRPTAPSSVLCKAASVVSSFPRPTQPKRSIAKFSVRSSNFSKWLRLRNTAERAKITGHPFKIFGAAQFSLHHNQTPHSTTTPAGPLTDPIVRSENLTTFVFLYSSSIIERNSQTRRAKRHSFHCAVSASFNTPENFHPPGLRQQQSPQLPTLLSTLDHSLRHWLDCYFQLRI